MAKEFYTLRNLNKDITYLGFSGLFLLCLMIAIIFWFMLLVMGGIIMKIGAILILLPSFQFWKILIKEQRKGNPGFITSLIISFYNKSHFSDHENILSKL
jgi:hypothetical protein